MAIRPLVFTRSSDFFEVLAWRIGEETERTEARVCDYENIDRIDEWKREKKENLWKIFGF